MRTVKSDRVIQPMRPTVTIDVSGAAGRTGEDGAAVGEAPDC